VRRKPPLPFVQTFGGYHYFRRRGFPRVRLPGLLFSPEFMAAYQEAMSLAPAPIGTSRSKPGSVAATVAAYFVSPEFRNLADGTQAMRRAILQRFRDQHGDKPIGPMPAKFIALVLGSMKPHAARSYFKAIRSLCQFALAAEMIKADPTQGMKLPKVKKSDGHHTWIEDEIARYEGRHPIGSKARLALGLGMYTLQRRGDVVQMGRQHIASGEVIRVGPYVIDTWLRSMKQQKTGTPYHLPIFPELKTLIEATPSEHLTFLVTKSGQPYRPNDFSDQFRAWCDEAGLPRRCTFHGLRKYGCVLFAENDCGAPEIAAWSGHLSLREVQRYIDKADQKKRARNAMVKVLNARLEREHNEATACQAEQPRLSKPLK
jgi:integrase